MESGGAVPKLMRLAKAVAMSRPGTFCFRYSASRICRYLRVRTFCGRGAKPPNPGGMRVTKNEREPRERTRLWMRPLRPSMMAATAMTLVTPMTMPRMVRAERTLRERTVSSATSRFSRSSGAVIKSLRAQRDHGVELGCLHRRVDAEKQADHGTEHDPESGHPALHRRREAGELAQAERAGEAGAN